MTATGQREQHPTGGAAPRVVVVGPAGTIPPGR